jgi:hypothetical protein
MIVAISEAWFVVRVCAYKPLSHPVYIVVAGCELDVPLAYRPMRKAWEVSSKGAPLLRAIE